MVKLDGKIWEGIKVQGNFSIGKKVKVWGRILGGTENMGSNESMAILLANGKANMQVHFLSFRHGLEAI